jgi:hypothetical protein
MMTLAVSIEPNQPPETSAFKPDPALPASKQPLDVAEQHTPRHDSKGTP